MSRANLVPSAKDVAYLRRQDFPTSERSRTTLPELLRKHKGGRRSTHTLWLSEAAERPPSQVRELPQEDRTLIASLLRSGHCRKGMADERRVDRFRTEEPKLRSIILSSEQENVTGSYQKGLTVSG